MKKLFLLFAAALMSVSMFATPAAVPTVTDLTGAGYDVNASRVICLYFDEQVCNDIVWAGTYVMNAAGDSWETNPELLSSFEPLEGFEGWYALELDDASNPCQGKPVQLKKDGSFNWDFQSGDPEAWINMAQPGTQTATIGAGYSGEANCTWPTTGAYIYEVAYFKNHNTPCAAPVEYKYTEYVNWQLKHEGSEWQWTENLVKVEEGVFKLADAYWTGSGFNVGSDANPIKKDWFAPEELVLGEEVLAPVTVDVYLKVIDDETVKIGVGVIPDTDPVWPEDAPTTAPAAPTVDGASILGAALTTSYAFEPMDWPGAMPQLLTFETGETIYYMEKMTWQIYTNWDEDSYDVSGYNMLHIDLYPATGTEIKITFECLSVDDGGQGYKNSVVKTLTAGQWNALDIALSEFPALASGDPYDFSDIKYFILEGYNAEQSALTVGNVYFYSVATALPSLFDDGVKDNKFLHNGQLIIRKGNKHFSALGAEVK